MDTKQLIKDSSARFNIISQKSQLKEKYNSKLIFADQGGLWKATPEFLSFLKGPTVNNLVILDLYENPIKVDKDLLTTKAYQLYTEVMNEWYTEYSKLQNNR